MSAERTSNTDTVVYVRLVDEGTDVWRPVPAAKLPDGTFELAQPVDYDPETEHWEFPPHTRVRCQAKKFAGGKQGLIAIQMAG